ncbi:tRNA (N6-threonylcarbamoyladenosine(37)-N6)-methyltransferase TrmO [Malonomonas rubra]|uniref:tRNA (N6-threonylcarbamoyladenosine(37)-N6)-methyltransferase TrmO n=1 Tax=Malonomonas rubra TaxID=57040 RepID=UPI0026EE72B9|nr:tRNA (N6-threonylcarbamoyladenosine(37)-N6)-methyltransferase TrmO [Malonomonas rubra]
MEYSCKPIALIRSPYREKFSAPRQPRLAPSVRARIELLPEFSSPEVVRGLENFSHIWLIFLFHQTAGQGWKPMVRPPRLGGNRRVGVFACRSPFRPNPIGLSAVKLLSIDCSGGKVVLEVQGADLIDNTPILDIKPYLPYTDGIAEAQGGFADRAPVPQLQVEFSSVAQQQLESFSSQKPHLQNLIVETLALDPRPAYKRNADDGRKYGVLLDCFNVRWQVDGEKVIVLAIEEKDF